MNHENPRPRTDQSSAGYLHAPGKYKAMVTKDAGDATPDAQKKVHLKSLVQGTVWRKRMFEGGELVTEIARAEGKTEAFITRLVKFSMMEPDIVRRILRGDIPACVMRERVINGWPVGWREQREVFSF